MSYDKEEIKELLACKWTGVYNNKCELLNDLEHNAFYADCKDWGVNPYSVIDMIGNIKYKDISK